MKLRNTFTALALAFSIAASAAFAQSIDSRSVLMKDGSVKLPTQLSSTFSQNVSETSTAGIEEFSDFNRANGAWNLSWDKQTHSAVCAYGKPIRIGGFDEISSDNVREAAEKFLAANEKLLGIKFSELQFVSSAFYGNLWYVRFKQVVGRLEVLTSSVSLRISPNGTVGYATTDFFNGIKLPTGKETNLLDVAKSATYGVSAKKNVEEIQAAPQNYILPIRTNKGVGYSIVKKFEFDGTGNQKYTSFVDAHSGDLLWRYNRIRDTKTSVSSKGTIRKNYANEEPVEVNFTDFYFWANDEEHIADASGKFDLDISAPVAIRDSLTSRWARVTNADRENLEFTGTATPGTDMVIGWNEMNSDIKMRTVFYHATFVHDYIKNIDPTFTGMDHQIALTLVYEPNSYYTSPNASSDPSTGDINYWVVGDETEALAESPSVLYHEYGHSIAGRFYIQHGVAEGLNNATVHEAYADLNSAFILDSPYIGLGTEVANPSGYIRLIDNQNIYPDSMQGESHNDSQILSGAYWDLRKLTNDLDYCRHIIHKVKFALIDDTDDGRAFYKFFRETLIADDNDNDLTNSTPHAIQIIRAFNNHNIGGLLALRQTFTHTPYPNTKDTVNPYQIEFEVTPMGLPGTNPDSAFITYTVNGMYPTDVPATQASAGKFMAKIPAQKAGDIVQYYMNIRIEGTSKFSTFSASQSFVQPYKFFIGYQTIVAEDFKNESKWTSGIPIDSAKTGVWEFAIPEETVFPIWGVELKLMPGTNHNGEVTKCWVTGAQAYDDPYEIIEHCPDALTSVVSPVYSINGFRNPLLQLHYWFVWMRIGGQNQGSINFRISASTDLGSSWTTLLNTTRDSIGWMELISDLSYLNIGQQGVMFKVSLNPVGKYKSTSQNKYFPVYMSKALFDGFSIIGIEDSTYISVQNDNQASGLTELNVFPNPLAYDNCNVSFRLNEASRVVARVYSTLGEEVATLKDDYMTTGYAMLNWNGITASGKKAASGVYQLVISANGKNYTSKIIVE